MAWRPVPNRAPLPQAPAGADPALARAWGYLVARLIEYLEAAAERINYLLTGDVERLAADATMEIPTYVRVLGHTGTGNARTYSLVENAREGQWHVLKDEGGAAGTDNLTLARQGTDTIDGGTSVVISTDYGTVSVYSDGAGGWFTW